MGPQGNHEEEFSPQRRELVAVMFLPHEQSPPPAPRSSKVLLGPTSWAIEVVKTRS